MLWPSPMWFPEARRERRMHSHWFHEGWGCHGGHPRVCSDYNGPLASSDWISAFSPRTPILGSLSTAHDRCSPGPPHPSNGTKRDEAQGSFHLRHTVPVTDTGNDIHENRSPSRKALQDTRTPQPVTTTTSAPAEHMGTWERLAQRHRSSRGAVTALPCLCPSASPGRSLAWRTVGALETCLLSGEECDVVPVLLVK